MLAYFDRPGTSNGPTEALNGCLNTSADPPRLPQPHQLHRPIRCLENRRIQTDYTLNQKSLVSGFPLSASPFSLPLLSKVRSRRRSIPPPYPVKPAPGADDPVARHDDADRIVAVGQSDRTAGEPIWAAISP